MEIKFLIEATQKLDLLKDNEVAISKEESYNVDDSIDHSTSNFTDPLSITATLTVVYLIKTITRFLVKDKEKGVQMDLRSNPATVSRISGIPMGFLVIIDKEGKATTQKIEYEADDNILQTVSEFLGKYLE